MKTQIDLNNPLLQEWSGAYGGVPDFTKYKISDFKPAIEFAIEEKLSEIERDILLLSSDGWPHCFTNI